MPSHMASSATPTKVSEQQLVDTDVLNLSGNAARASYVQAER